MPSCDGNVVDAIASLEMSLEPLSNALMSSEPGEDSNITDGVLAIAKSLSGIVGAVHRLGNGDASTPFGGLEAHGMCVKELGDAVRAAGDVIAESISELAEAVRQSRANSGS